MERNLPGYEKNRSHYDDDDAVDRLRGYKTQWGEMAVDGCWVGKDFLNEISGQIDDFCIYWIRFWPWPAHKNPPLKIASYPKYPSKDEKEYKLGADLKISTPDLEFRTYINEPSTQNFMDYLKYLDQNGLNVKDVFTKIIITKVKGKKGRHSYLMSFQR
jgi:hypothetical protein